MALIQPVKRPIYYAVTGTLGSVAVVESGITQVGDNTGIANALSVVSDEDENKFVGALPVKVWPELPDFGWLEAGKIYQYSGRVVLVRQAHSRTECDPADVPALFLVSDGKVE